MQRGFIPILNITWFWGKLKPNHEYRISFPEISRPVTGFYGIAFGGHFFGYIRINLNHLKSTDGLIAETLKK